MDFDHWPLGHSIFGVRNFYFPFPFVPLASFTGLHKHESWAGDGVVPNAQGVHELDPGPGAYVPGGHVMQARAARPEVVPLGQGAQSVRRVK